MGRVREKLTYANVVATIALFFALAGGSAVAAKLMISGSNVRNSSLTGADIRNRSIDSEDIATDGVRSTDIRDGTIEDRDLDPELYLELLESGGDGGGGSVGAKGPKGDKGDKGDPGSAGPGRGAKSTVNCDPTSATLVDCVSVTMTVPAGGGRVLLLATGTWYATTTPLDPSMRCRIAEGVENLVEGDFGSPGAYRGTVSLQTVTGVLGAGPHTFKLSCRELEAAAGETPDDATLLQSGAQITAVHIGSL